MSSSLVFAIVPTITENKDLLRELPEQLTAFKISLQSLISEIKAAVEKDMQRYIEQERGIAGKIDAKQLEISDKSIDTKNLEKMQE